MPPSQIWDVTFEVPRDLNLTSFDEAVVSVGDAHASSYILVHTSECADVARYVAYHRGCKLLELPPGVMRNQYAWAVTTGACCAWSAPTT